MQIFYNSLDNNLRPALDGASGGALMNHRYERVCQIIDDMDMNSYMWPKERFT